MSITSRNAACLVLCISLGLACSTSTGRTRAEATKSDLASFRTELAAAQKQIELLDSIMSSLTGSSGPQLQSAFTALKKESRVLGTQAGRVRTRADAMHASGRRYFTEWEVQAQQMGNPAIRQASSERRNELLATYGALAQSMRDTGAAYRPYESSLSDIVTFLDNDLTPSGVRAISGEVKEAKLQGRDVHARIGQVLDRSSEVKLALSAQAG